MTPKSKYKTPDSTWEFFNIIDFNDYEEKCIVKGKFIPEVPVDVKEAYESAEHIMAQAFYRYPLLDEAANKLLRILEMAVKLRCEGLGIHSTYIDKRGKERRKNLSQFINELDKFEPNKNLKNGLESARQIRNEIMHPNTNSLHGMVAMNIFRQMVNIYNQLFLDEQYFKDKNALIQKSEKEVSFFKNGLFFLERDSHKYLIQGTKPLIFEKIKGEWASFWVAHPVYKNFKKMVEGKQLMPPIFFLMREYKTEGGSIRGKDLNDNIIKISFNDKIENERIHEIFLNEQSQLDKIELISYQNLLSAKLGSELMNFIYQNCWD